MEIDAIEKNKKYFRDQEAIEVALTNICLWKNNANIPSQAEPDVHPSLPNSVHSSNKNIKHKESLSLGQKMVLFLRETRSKDWFHQCYAGWIIIFAFIMMINEPDGKDEITKIANSLAMVCNYVFLIFAVLRLLSLEPFHWGWCSLELISLIAGLSQIFVINETALRILQAISCLRLLIIVRTTSLFTPFNNMIRAMKNANKIIIPALALIYLYSIIGLYSFSGKLTHKHRKRIQSMPA